MRIDRDVRLIGAVLLVVVIVAVLLAIGSDWLWPVAQ
jgi:hypothetical protein